LPGKVDVSRGPSEGLDRESNLVESQQNWRGGDY